MVILFTVVAIVLLIGLLCLSCRFYVKQKEKVSVIFPKKEKENIIITTPYVVKTHTDEDGAGPAILAKYFFGEDNVTIFSTPNAVMDKTIREIMDWTFTCPTTIFITDISCKLDTAKELEGWLTSHPDVKIVLLDHHKTALDLNKVSFCKVMVEKDSNSLPILAEPKNGYYGLNCGTSLFYEYLINELGLIGNKVLETYVNLITAYDTWMWVNDFNSEDIYKKWDSYFHLLGWDLYIEKVLAKLKSGNLEFDEMDEYVFSIDDVRRKNYVERKMRTLYFRKWFGYNACFVQCDDYLADIVDEIYSRYEGVEVVALVTPTSISLRSRSDSVDVAAIAKNYGGGGHTQAAGFSIPRKTSKVYYWYMTGLK